MAFWKMVGLVVTPTTYLSLIRSAKSSVASLLRLRSSSQMATPSSLSCRSASVMGCSSPWQTDPWLTHRRSVARLGAGDDADPLERGMGGRDDAVGGEAELLVEHRVGRARAEVVEGDDLARVTDDLAPALADRRLDADPGLYTARQHPLPVGRVLLVEPLDARHRHHPRRRALGLERLPGGDREVHLRAGGDQHDLRLAVGGVGQDVAAILRALGRLEDGPVPGRDVLAGQA